MHLTNKRLIRSDAFAASGGAPGAAGAPEHEIEITPAMIKAGAHELGMFDSEYSSFEEGAERIFFVMLDMMKTSQPYD
jgi:hypothetical protein